jgi:hypothetical protein
MVALCPHNRGDRRSSERWPEALTTPQQTFLAYCTVGKGFPCACSTPFRGELGRVTMGWTERRGRIVIRKRMHKSWNKGWTSADRSTRATLMLTVPSFITKSSTKDLTWPTFCIAVKYCVDPKAIGTPTLVKVNIVVYQHGFWLRGVQS